MTDKHTLNEEQVETSATSEPIYGYRIEKGLLPSFVKKAKELTNNQCLILTKEDGDFVKVVVLPAGDKPSQEFIAGMARLQDAMEFAQYKTCAAETEVDF